MRLDKIRAARLELLSYVASYSSLHLPMNLTNKPSLHFYSILDPYPCPALIVPLLLAAAASYSAWISARH